MLSDGTQPPQALGQGWPWPGGAAAVLSRPAEPLPRALGFALFKIRPSLGVLAALWPQESRVGLLRGGELREGGRAGPGASKGLGRGWDTLATSQCGSWIPPNHWVWGSSWGGRRVHRMSPQW